MLAATIRPLGSSPLAQPGPLVVHATPPVPPSTSQPVVDSAKGTPSRFVAPVPTTEQGAIRSLGSGAGADTAQTGVVASAGSAPAASQGAASPQRTAANTASSEWTTFNAMSGGSGGGSSGGGGGGGGAAVTDVIGDGYKVIADSNPPNAGAVANSVTWKISGAIQSQTLTWAQGA